MRQSQFFAIMHLRDLLVKQMDKERTKPIKKARDVLLLIDGILENFDAFYNFGDNVNVFMSIDYKKNITKIKIGA